jgi:thiosulfate reductase cytochrome b subunit
MPCCSILLHCVDLTFWVYSIHVQLWLLLTRWLTTKQSELVNEHIKIRHIPGQEYSTNRRVKLNMCVAAAQLQPKVYPLY